MTDLTTKILAHRTIKPSTLASYLHVAKKLSQEHTGSIYTDPTFLTKYDDVCEKLKGHKLCRQKRDLNAMCVILDAEDADSELIEKYKALHKTVSGQYDDMLATRMKTEQTAKKWCSKAELDKCRRAHANACRRMGIHKKEPNTLTPAETKQLQQHLVSSLYLLHPPRRNIYAGMKVVRTKAAMNDTDNFLLVTSRNRKFFYINDQKSSKFDAQQIIPVNSKLNSVLNHWMRHNTTQSYLLRNTKGAPMTKNQLSKFMNVTFKGTGHRVGSSLIRKIHHTEKFGDVVNAIEDDAKAMGHTAATALKHYVKK